MLDVDVPVEPQRRKCDHNTPEDILEAFRRYKPICLDPCSNPWSTVDAMFSLSQHDGADGLAASWTMLFWPGHQVFVNPDYADIGPWVEKAAEEAKNGVSSSFLVPCSPETKWSRLARSLCSAWGPWAKRIPFIGAGGAGAKQPSATYHFGPDRHLFAHHMEPALAFVEVMPRRWGQE